MAGPTSFPKHGPTHSVGSIGSQNGFPSVPKANPGGARPGRPPYPHIDDIVSVDVDVDINAPIDKMLLTAETYLRQAESANTFGRPDLALKDYIRTNILVLDYIKKNKGWVSLQADSKGGLVRYQNLLRLIHALSGDFERIKADIKADNAISHVQPTVRRPTPGGEPKGVRETQDKMQGQSLPGGHTSMNGAAPPRQNGGFARPAAPSPKSKPAVQPKPQGLHGSVVTGNEDLAQRFARLRTNASSAQNGQDPRIRTQPIVPSNIAAPQPGQAPRRAPPPPPPSRVPAGLPRLPDAIYNPARGTVSTEAAELPSSAPRAMFTRTNSATVVPPAKPVTAAAPEEYFVPAQSFKPTPATPAKTVKATIPESETISAEELVRYMRMGAKSVSILLIDIRSRELFDEGHIMSQATICLDPEVLMRSDISANEIADSMVLAPVEEQLLFEKRHEFDLVVFYDQDSLRITRKMDTPEQKAISGLYNALIHYDFPGLPSKRMRPKLLEGGLDAWTGIVGASGLQISSTSSASKASTTMPMARSFLARRQTYITRPIQDAAEARRWEETLSDMVPVRTKEDFLRRMVPIGPIQESMVQPPSYSPVETQQSPFQSRMSHDDVSYSTLPPPPARPAPTLPRRSYSGLAETGSPSGMQAMRVSLSQGIERIRRYRTGFKNPGVHCFANSSLQAMFATPGFAQELWSGMWLSNYGNPPRKKGETMSNPQLLVKALANIFLHLDSGEVPCMSTQIFMDYIKRIHSMEGNGKQRLTCNIFGGPDQQDAQEFYAFIMSTLHDETNKFRDLPPVNLRTYTPADGTIIQNAIDAWTTHSQSSNSIVDKYFRGLDVNVKKCLNDQCQHEQRDFSILEFKVLHLPPVVARKGQGEIQLNELLDQDHEPEELPESTCDKCKRNGRKHETRFARLPDRLAFCLGRFDLDSRKLNNKVRFPIRNLDLTAYMAEPDPVGTATNKHHYAGRMIYDCYAVTIHRGQTISSGHYFTYVQDEQSKDPGDWWKCDDEWVERVKIDGGPATEAMYKEAAASAYMVYYRRRGF
ncbi:ubiquitin carboxyl-terminal hydrolase 8 [Podospora conica]|nr:ubiquitin carboxyl-terminal hydrolase 8 [Schizothecium conicum]